MADDGEHDLKHRRRLPQLSAGGKHATPPRERNLLTVLDQL